MRRGFSRVTSTATRVAAYSRQREDICSVNSNRAPERVLVNFLLTDTCHACQSNMKWTDHTFDLINIRKAFAEHAYIARKTLLLKVA